jgi:hypothetical protein
MAAEGADDAGALPWTPETVGAASKRELVDWLQVRQQQGRRRRLTRQLVSSWPQLAIS